MVDAAILTVSLYKVIVRVSVNHLNAITFTFRNAEVHLDACAELSCFVKLHTTRIIDLVSDIA